MINENSNFERTKKKYRFLTYKKCTAIISDELSYIINVAQSAHSIDYFTHFNRVLSRNKVDFEFKSKQTIISLKNKSTSINSIESIFFSYI